VKQKAAERIAFLKWKALERVEYYIDRPSQYPVQSFAAAKDILDRDPETSAVHKIEDVTPADRMTQDERMARIRQLEKQLGRTEQVQ
jgi:hypothetical protein